MALVDTGCSKSIVASRLVGYDSSRGTSVRTVDNRLITCRGEKRGLMLDVLGRVLKVDVIVMDELIPGIDFILGYDVAVNLLGGVTVTPNGVTFNLDNDVAGAVVEGSENENKIEINDPDFRAEFDGKKWVVEWLFKPGQEPVLKNKVSCYGSTMKGSIQNEFDEEIQNWIKEGILVPWKEKVNVGVIPLMAVVQQTKGKVRPIFDFREINGFLESHTGGDNIDVCSESLRNWRKVGGAKYIVDLKSAYLQLQVAANLWKYQLVNYKGKTFCLTRVAFGMTSAPRIMSVILKNVLSKNSRIKEGAWSYIDDILVDESVVSAREVVAHLQKYGLVAKEPVEMQGGAVLGLKLTKDRYGVLKFNRGNEIPNLEGNITKRELFSICGKLVGHYPIANWLRIACSYIKRCAEGSKWEDFVGNRALGMLRETLNRVESEDPVTGVWYVPRTENGVIWCDASSIATAALVEINDVVVEDAAWLRKSDDCGHINVAELDSTLKGLN